MAGGRTAANRQRATQNCLRDTGSRATSRCSSDIDGMNARNQVTAIARENGLTRNDVSLSSMPSFADNHENTSRVKADRAYTVHVRRTVSMTIRRLNIMR